MTNPTYKFEKQKLAEGYGFIIGCDEVGRGCLAGPVVAAAVVLPPWPILRKHKWHKQLNDSKLLTPGKRFMLEEKLRQVSPGIGIGRVSERIIDEINIHNASLLAMSRAVDDLWSRFSYETLTDETSGAGFMFVDGRFPVPGLEKLTFNNQPLGQQPVIDADAKILSVSAASIIAKTYRDRLMTRWHKKMPAYRFDQHKGYGTALHRKLISQHGISALHRRSFVHII
jgi:ribonuclease HII